MEYDFTGLKALFLNGTLKKSPTESYTERMINVSAHLMEKHGVQTETVRMVDHDIAFGVSPDMREEGWEKDDWPRIYKEGVARADILVLATPIWLGDYSAVMKQTIERLYANASEQNEKGQFAYYGKVGGCLVDGNEDGVKHISSKLLYALQHIGCMVPPQAEAGWTGWTPDKGPTYNYLDKGSGAAKNDFTNVHITFMTWNLMHMAQLLKDNGGLPAWGNSMSEWSDGETFGFEIPAESKPGNS